MDQVAGSSGVEHDEGRVLERRAMSLEVGDEAMSSETSFGLSRNGRRIFAGRGVNVAS